MAVRISCVVAVWNGERFLAEALKSIFRQTLAPAEVIVIDDGSDDGTAAVAQRFGARLSYVRQDQAGPAAARNRGVAEASGELVAFLDHDDLWHEEKLERQAAGFVARPELGVSMTHIRNFWVPELIEEQRRLAGTPFSSDRPGYTAQTMMLRPDLFERIGPLDPAKLNKDIIDWLLRAMRAGVVVEVMPDVLTLRRIHETNRSRSRQGIDGEELLALAQALLDQRRRAAAAAP